MVKDYVFNEIDNLKHLESESKRKKVIDIYLSNETEVDMIKNKTGQLWRLFFNLPNLFHA